MINHFVEMEKAKHMIVRGVIPRFRLHCSTGSEFLRLFKACVNIVCPAESLYLSE